MNLLRSRRLVVVLVVFVLGVAFALAAGCGSSQEPEPGATTPAEAKVMTYAGAMEPTTWDPSTGAGQEVTFFANTYEALIKANPAGSPEPYSPWLATEWSVSEDGLVWTFHLREGVKFHDGTEFNADAVKYSIDRVIRLNLGMAYMYKPVKEVRVVDPSTVEFELEYAVSLEPILSAASGAWMISPATASEGDEWFNEATPHEAGTGPYMLESYSPKEQAVFNKFEDYWGGWSEGQFDKVVYKFVPEPQTERQMLESGEVDVAMSLSKDLAEQLTSNADLNVEYFPSAENIFVYINCQRKPLDNVLVRQALSYATPYEDIIMLAENGKATQSHGPIPLNVWPGDEALGMYTYDLEKAKELLAKAGYPDGGFDILFTVSSSRQAEVQAATLIKESYGKLGINVTVRPMPYNEQWALAKGPKEDRQDLYAMYWWPGYADGYDTLAQGWITEDPPAYALSYWYNKEYDDLIWQAHIISGSDRSKSKDMFMDAQQMLIDEAVALYLFDIQSVLASRKTVEGAALNVNYPMVIFWYDMKAAG